MSHSVLQGTPPAPPQRSVPNDLGERINQAVNDAVNDALSEVQDNQPDNARQGLKEAIEEMKAEIEAARAEGRTVTIQPQFDTENIIPRGVVDMSVAFFVMLAFVIVGLPLARAFARRMDRRSEPASAGEIAPRLDRIEQAIEAIAIEVERVSEGQRYTTKAISDLRGLPASNPIGGWPAGAREAERVPVGESKRGP
jgi:hypothetical protein